HSGNQTTSLSEGLVCDGGTSAAPCTLSDGSVMPGGLPAPNRNFQGTAGPETGLIVRFDPSSGRWEDRLGRNWSPAVRFSHRPLDGSNLTSGRWEDRLGRNWSPAVRFSLPDED